MECKDLTERANLLIKARTECDKARRMSLGSIKEKAREGGKKALSSTLLKRGIAQEIAGLFSEERYTEEAK